MLTLKNISTQNLPEVRASFRNKSGVAFNEPIYEDGLIEIKHVKIGKEESKKSSIIKFNANTKADKEDLNF